MNMEYGSFLPFDMGTSKEYYEGEEVVSLNCARYGIIYSILDAEYKKLYIPFYMCPTVKEALVNYSILFEEYHINSEFEPIGVELGKKEAILIFNFCGLISREKIEKMVAKYKNVIIDNSQAFFSKPILDVYNVYSCRKFLGVVDGCYVVKKGIKHFENTFEEDFSSKRIKILFSSLEHGTNYAYKKYLEIEEGFSNSKIMRISKSTREILKRTDYKSIIKKRDNNYEAIFNRLEKYHLGSYFYLNREIHPMKYPIIVSNGQVTREKLKERKIYSPYWWNGIKEKNEFENDLVENLILLPLDQRYSVDDINVMIDIVINILVL